MIDNWWKTWSPRHRASVDDLAKGESASRIGAIAAAGRRRLPQQDRLWRAAPLPASGISASPLRRGRRREGLLFVFQWRQLDRVLRLKEEILVLWCGR
ncbi:hypothetical protein [Streptomyces sp. NPDC059759]|uniref:hypothetical protein n=1 Tax=Streptomyces sp. NPDC059759 TaxID=3346936 RepID=UPI00365300FA